jgi:hypothetical protein
MAHIPHSHSVWRLISRLCRVLIGILGLACAVPARGQPCITCRAERCTAKVDLKTWCGSGRDPLLPSRSKSERAPVGRQAIAVDSDPPGAAVHLGRPDGEVLGTTPLTKLVLARGRYQLWLTLSGHQATVLDVEVQSHGPRHYSITLTSVVTPAAESEIVQVEPPPQPSSEPEKRLSVRSDPVPPPAEPRKVPVYKKWWLWTIVGVAAAGTAAGIAGGVVASRNGPPDSQLGTVRVFTINIVP